MARLDNDRHPQALDDIPRIMDLIAGNKVRHRDATLIQIGLHVQLVVTTHRHAFYRRARPQDAPGHRRRVNGHFGTGNHMGKRAVFRNIGYHLEYSLMTTRKFTYIRKHL